MELTQDQALQKGIEAHKAGKVQEADQYYTAILKANPKHPDANHNMGVLAVSVGKVEEALPFFKTALDFTPTIAQYWLSYIDALIKLNRMIDAKTVFDQAKSNGANGDAFDTLEQRISRLEKNNIVDATYGKLKEPPTNELQRLIHLYTQGKHQETQTQASQLLKRYPNSINLYNILGAANKGLRKLNEAIEAYKKAISIQPDYVDAYYNMGNALKDQDRLDEAIEAYKKAISIKPDYAEVYYNMGIALKDQGKLDEATEAYKIAISIKPDYAEAHNNIGIALKDQGKLDEAIEAYKKAISTKPDYVNAYNNMGILLKISGKLDEAIEAYNKAISIKPDYAEAHNNIGIALKDQGKLDEATEAYKKAISIKPNYAEAYNNMGSALNGQGKPNKAIQAYKKALSIKPDYDEALWNGSGTAENLNEAKKWIKKCVLVNPNRVEAKLMLTALEFYQNNRSEFDLLLQSPFKDHPYVRSFSWAFSLSELPPLYFHRWGLFDHMIELSKKDRPFYEFGVWRGEAFKYLIKAFKKGYGFDTFEGLPEDWHNEKAGTYSSDCNVPKIEGGEFIVGKFEDTLPGFFAQKRPMASIINFDADLYSSTICALNFTRSVIDKHTILIFDEFLINDNWEQDEYKALEEFCANNDYTYKVLAISFFTKQVAVKLIGI